MFFLKYILQYLRRYYRVEEGLEYVEALRHLNKPSEVTVPNELIPAAVLMQLRGLVNIHVLSIHSDWVWPYWMTRQSSPKSESFIPRAMGLTYINLTHRQWTGVGFLGGRYEAIVDPRGAVTPWNNGWSLDTWLVDGHELCLPSHLEDRFVRQWRHEQLPWVFTELRFAHVHVLLETFPIRVEDVDYVVQQVLVHNPGPREFSGKVVLAIRPANPEGVSLIHELTYNSKGFWLVNKSLGVLLADRPESWLASNHERGDVAKRLCQRFESEHVAHCPAGLCTGAAVYPARLSPGRSTKLVAIMPLERIQPRGVAFEFFSRDKIEQHKSLAHSVWRAKMQEGAELELPDARLNDVFEANRATLLLLHDGFEVTAGPFTYHRHWFRDAAFLLAALDKLGYHRLVADVLQLYPGRQWKNGYFCAQKGEWDSNGEAIWSICEHYRLSGDDSLLRLLYPAVRRGALWIERKRHDVSITKRKPKGLLPAGFSAEHLGPNDFYYWDNFWSLRGLLDAADVACVLGHRQDHETLTAYARQYRRDILDSIHFELEHNPDQVLPAAPGRPPDAGMIGNICAAYPLGLFDITTTPWLANTVRFIRDHLFHGDGFYQEMIHSGVNTYLTLQMAQCLLMLGDLSAFDLIEYVRELASPTLCWPEAIHPRTRSGCMGDAHHGWTAAEWILLLRSLLLVEKGSELHLTPCVPIPWYTRKGRMLARRAPTYFGPVDVEIRTHEQGAALHLDARWSTAPSAIVWTLPLDGFRVTEVRPADAEFELRARSIRLSPEIQQVLVAYGTHVSGAPESSHVLGLADYLGHPPEAR